MASKPVCYINGKRRVLPPGRAESTLLQYLREIGLTGTKLGCGEGGCGACTVMLSNVENGELQHRSANACLCPLYSVDGMHVVTVEGIGNSRDGLHPVQERLANSHGSQCGFCTPGFVMSMYALLRSKAGAPTEQEIQENLAGNLCRCTGYRPILDAFRVFSEVPAGAYTEEAIAAHTQKAGDDDDVVGLPKPTGYPANGNGTIKMDPSKAICPSTGRPCDCGAASNGNDSATSQAVSSSGSDDDLHTHANGHASTANGTCAENGCADKPQQNGCGGCAGTDKSAGVKIAGTDAPSDSDAKKADGVEIVRKAQPAKQRWTSAVEPIFPAELRKREAPVLNLPGPYATWHRPVSLDGLLQLREQYPEGKIVVGNTEIGIEMKYGRKTYPIFIAATHVPELNIMEVGPKGLTVGSAVTLTKLMKKMKQLVAERPKHETRTYQAMGEQMKYFAGNQIRNTASVGGNICTASPISDLNPIYMSTGSVFTVQGEGTGVRSIPAKDFFLGYRKVDMQPHEVLLNVHIPFTQEHDYIREYKQAHRRDDDIAIANAGMRVRMKMGSEGEWVVAEAEIALGGVAPRTILAPLTMAAITGLPWNKETLSVGIASLAQDVYINSQSPGGMVEFRRAMAASFFFRFFMHVAFELDACKPGSCALFPETYRSGAIAHPHKPLSTGMQYFSKVPGDQVIGQPYRHAAAHVQVTGEAHYTDDIPLPSNALRAALVYSDRPHAKLLSVDGSPAFEVEGVEGFFSAKDVPGHDVVPHSIPGSNQMGSVMHDEEVFALDEVKCVGQVIGVVVADTEQHARMGAQRVQIEYEDLPSIISCEDAIKANSYFEGWGHRLDYGDVETCFSSGECDHIIEGTARIGGQEHFYLEPHCSVVIPQENDEICLYASTQAPNHHMETVAEVLGIPSHKVVCHVKRIGGGFGGKESRSVFTNAAIAVAAHRTRRPVRLTLDRAEDMQMTGHRHAFLIKYKVGFTNEGKILAMDVNLYNNAGCSLDLSAAVMDRALMHCENSYRIPNVRAIGHVCRTNVASNTAFRGFGGPQGLLAAEFWMDHVAGVLKRPTEELREINMFHEGEETHFTQILDKCQVRSCWDGVVAQADVEERQKEIAAFNKQNRWRKRGLAILPTMFGISFTTKFLNQAGALIHIYTDGSVLVTHGGVEMGQGLHTKVAMVAAQDLGCKMENVHIAETATDKVPNSSPTAASASSDLYGSATADACRQLNERLAPFREKMPKASFAEIAKAAYLERVDLSAHGFYATPDITGFGGRRPFNYFTYGACCAEVELDALNGNFDARRVDIVMDVGASLNPAIDIGQIEGGFMQGMGWSCLEELVWGDEGHPWVKRGHLQTKGPGTYKIPTAKDIPLDMRVTLLRDSPNHRLPMVHSSKAIGEPPLFLGATCFFAIKNAISAAREDAGHPGWFPLDSPATPERVRMACADDLTVPFAPVQWLPHISC